VDDRVVIDRRFNGPPNSANGGYTCGLVGTAVKAPAVRVSLRKPPPLDVPLLRQRRDDGSVSLLRGDDIIATAVPGVVEAQAPPAPTVEQAEIATRRYVGFTHHRFPTCFVCGTARDDGLRIYAGQVGDGPLIASPWTPESDDPLFAWAVLDCPSAYAIESVDHRAQIVVLASLTVELRERPRAGERHVVAAWPISSNGRKHHSASALYGATGHVLAVADALWFELRDPGRARRPSRSIRYRLCSGSVNQLIKSVLTSIMVSIGRSSEAETRHVCSACSAASPALRCRSPTRRVRAGDRACENGRLRDKPPC